MDYLILIAVGNSKNAVIIFVSKIVGIIIITKFAAYFKHCRRANPIASKFSGVFIYKDDTPLFLPICGWVLLFKPPIALKMQSKRKCLKYKLTFDAIVSALLPKSR